MQQESGWLYGPHPKQGVRPLGVPISLISSSRKLLVNFMVGYSGCELLIFFEDFKKKLEPLNDLPHITIRANSSSLSLAQLAIALYGTAFYHDGE